MNIIIKQSVLIRSEAVHDSAVGDGSYPYIG